MESMQNSLIYLVVMAPQQTRQTALSKAALMAKKTNARLEIFACTYREDEELHRHHSRHDAKHSARKTLEQWTNTQLDPVIQQGICATTHIEWNSNTHASACHRAEEIGADMIILGHDENDDNKRQLLRSSPCPVLLAYGEHQALNGTVLAALDVQRIDDEHLALNHAVLAAGFNLAEDTQSALHLVCALDEKEAIATHLGFEYLEDIEANQAEIANRYCVPKEQVHVQLGNPPVVISEWVDKLDADLLVIGTKARKGIAGALLGNTSEKVLARVQTDILVVN